MNWHIYLWLNDAPGFFRQKLYRKQVVVSTRFWHLCVHVLFYMVTVWDFLSSFFMNTYDFVLFFILIIWFCLVRHNNFYYWFWIKYHIQFPNLLYMCNKITISHGNLETLTRLKSPTRAHWHWKFFLRQFSTFFRIKANWL